MAGIRWGGVNNTFARNHVSDGPHNCFLGGGNEMPAADCVHEDNIIENCAYEASDTGAWYVDEEEKRKEAKRREEKRREVKRSEVKRRGANSGLAVR